VSTFLARKRRPPTAVGKSPEVTVDVPVDARELRWMVPADAGRRYARVSGDYNPIHLWTVTARPFGFDRPIVHGMWSLARVVAALGPGLGTEALTVAVSFKRPVALPAQVTLKHWPAGKGTAFVLQDSEGRKPHLVGELSRGSPRPG
jgi:acyl dehydratase